MLPLTNDHGLIEDEPLAEAVSHASEPRRQGFAHPPSHVAAMGIRPGMVVADFGSGSGAHVFPLAEAVGSGGRVFAIDIQRDLLRRIKNEANRRKHSHVDVLWGDLEERGGSKLADEYVDLVLMSNLLFLLRDKHAALAEAARILKPSGMLAIIDWRGDAQTRRSGDRAGLPVLARGGPHRDHIVPKDDALKIALQTGYEPVRAFDAGSHHYGLIFRRVARDVPDQI